MSELQTTSPTPLWYETIDAGSLPLDIRCSCFTGTNGLAEYNITITPDVAACFRKQLDLLSLGYEFALNSLALAADTAVLRRFFCSDLANQQRMLVEHPIADVEAPCAISIVGQPPLPDAKVTLWAYHVEGKKGDFVKTRNANTIQLQRGELTHYWTMGCQVPEAENSCQQTKAIFNDYQDFLDNGDMALADNVVRTWLFVRDIDQHYQGMVDARRELFLDQGLSPETHYIASTGIEAKPADTRSCVTMDAYAVGALRPEQIQYLHAADHLGPTHLYGVSFERGTSISYRDRRHLFISGTASINPQGDILHEGDVQQQLLRTLDNISALLADGGATLADMAHLIIYLRDSSDYTLVRHIFDARFPGTPVTIVQGAVCRPGWLVEVEGIAITPDDNPVLPIY